jgi:cyclophilin family peptidyl-prolyl cis-trans isomerase
MSNFGEKNTNSSQFYITTNIAPWLDQVHVVFGKVINGFEIVDQLDGYGDEFSNDGKIPDHAITISDCGQFTYSKERLPFPPMPPKSDNED